MESVIDDNILKQNYPDLKYNDEKQEIKGKIHIECLCRDEFIKDDFEIKVQLFKDNIPKVWEVSNKIRKNYPHLYDDKRLCLATDLEQELYLKNYTIIDWIGEYVKKYFVSYIYYTRYGVFPFGEHSHGNKGIYEFIQKYLKLDSIVEAKNIYEYICKKKYRGHLMCPCGSGKKIRNCHGKLIQEILSSNEIEILKHNYRRMQNVGKNR